MCCYHSRGTKAGNRGPETGPRSRSSGFRLQSLRDDSGAAALEGIIVLAILAGVLFAVLLLGMWGTSLQSAQMGARLLTFDAGDVPLAKLGKPANQPVQSESTSAWYTLVGPTVHPAWLDAMVGNLTNDRYFGRVTGTQSGRLPGETRSLFDYTPASMGYRSGASAGTNSWDGSASSAESTFLGIAYWVGFNRQTPEGLTSKQTVPDPPANIAVLLGTIYAEVGVPIGP